MNTHQITQMLETIQINFRKFNSHAILQGSRNPAFGLDAKGLIGQVEFDGADCILRQDSPAGYKHSLHAQITDLAMNPCLPTDDVRLRPDLCARKFSTVRVAWHD